MGAEPTFQTGFEALGHDLKDYVATCYEMLRAELTAGLGRMRGAALLLAAAALFALPALTLLGFCMALTIALAFGAFHNQVGLIWGFLIAGGAGLVLAAILAAAGKCRLKAADLAPKRTLHVLRLDGAIFRQGAERYGDESAKRGRA
jgi:Putative Actinobacterial Holin-X, holin superfamily III